jgi:hypothetical protein
LKIIHPQSHTSAFQKLQNDIVVLQSLIPIFKVI